MNARTPIAICILLTVVASLLLPAPASAARTFSSTTAIAIPASGVATPYPSTIAVAGIDDPVTKVSVTLGNISHAFPGDLDVLLVGPGGQSVILLSDSGSGLDIDHVTLTFDDQARAPLSRFAQITTGRYQPLNYGTADGFPAPAPSGPRVTTLSVFNGLDPNGIWSLYVVDDAYADGGAIGSWSLTFSTGQAPSFETLGAQSVAEAATLDVPLVVSDDDGDALAFVDEGVPPFASVIPDGVGGWLLHLAPGYDDAGSYTGVPLAFTDGGFLTRQFITIVVSATNRPPTLEPLGARSVMAGRRLEIPLVATDADGTLPDLAADNLPSFATFTSNLDGTGTLALAPTVTDAGSWPNIIVTATDGAATTSVTLVLTVIANQPPLLAPIGDIAVAEGDTRQIGISATDDDGDPLTLAATNLPAFVTLTDQGGSTWLLELAPGFNDEKSYPDVRFTLSDGGYVVTETIAITVTHTNLPPAIDALAAPTVREGDSVALEIAANDPDGDPLTLALADNPAFATLADRGDGTATLTLAPLPGEAGTYGAFSITANDGLASASVPVTVTVIPNQAPLLDPIADVTLDDSTSTTVTVQAGDSDGDTLTLTAAGLPPFASLLDHGDGSATITISPGAADHGTFAGLEVQASDGVASASQTFRIVVNDINQSPIVLPGTDATIANADGTGTEVVVLDGSLSTDSDGTLAVIEWRSGTTLLASTLTTTVQLGIGSHEFELHLEDDDGANVSASITIVIVDGTAPVTVATPSTPVAAGGWYKSAVTLELAATDHTDGSGVREITYAASGAITLALTTVTGTTVSIPITKQGETLVSFWARDEAGNTEATRTIGIRIDKQYPVATPPRAELITGSIIGQSGTPFRVSWATSDGRSGIYRVAIALERNGTFSQFPTTAAATGSLDTQAVFGRPLRLRARATDNAGLTTGWSYSAPFNVGLVDDTSTDITLSGGTWSRKVNNLFSSGSTLFASEAGTTATYTFSGTSVGLLSATGLGRGTAEIRIDGDLIETVNLSAPTLVAKQLAFTANHLDPATTHTITVTVTGSGRIDLDGFVVIS